MSLLNEHQGLGLEPADVSRLVERTEGWPAGLYMAALSLRGRTTRTTSSPRFAGDDRNVVDYLTTEVLNRAARRRLRLPAADVRARTALPGAVRRGHRAASGSARSAPADGGVEFLRHRPRQQAALVPLPPPLPGPACATSCSSPSPNGRSTAHRRAAHWLQRRTGILGGDPPHDRGRGPRRGRRDGGRRRGAPVAYAGSHQTIQAWLEALPPRRPSRRRATVRRERGHGDRHRDSSTRSPHGSSWPPRRRPPARSTTDSRPPGPRPQTACAP